MIFNCAVFEMESSIVNKVVVIKVDIEILIGIGTTSQNNKFKRYFAIYNLLQIKVDE